MDEQMALVEGDDADEQKRSKGHRIGYPPQETLRTGTGSHSASKIKLEDNTNNNECWWKDDASILTPILPWMHIRQFYWEFLMIRVRNYSSGLLTMARHTTTVVDCLQWLATQPQ